MTLPLLSAASGSPTALGSATITEFKNDVDYQSPDGTLQVAKAEDVIPGHDVVKTGGNSMTELEFTDGTLGRLGSYSVFTFDGDSREVQTQGGLGVFFVPKDMGGLRIVSPALIGTVESGAVVVEQIDAGHGNAIQHWTRFLLVAGTGARVSLPNGAGNVSLHAGQGIFQREGDSKISPRFDFDVKALTENAKIFTGFHRVWPGLDDIHAVIDKQFRALQDGKMVHAAYYWKGRGTQQGTLPPQFPVPDRPGMDTPPYNDSGSRGGLLLYEFKNVAGANQPPSTSSIK